jgi:hypothetical protein
MLVEWSDHDLRRKRGASQKVRLTSVDQWALDRFADGHA